MSLAVWPESLALRRKAAKVLFEINLKTIMTLRPFGPSKRARSQGRGLATLPVPNNVRDEASSHLRWDGREK